MYNQKVMNAFAQAKNAGVLRGANGVGTATDQVCGDTIRIYLNIQDDMVAEAKFKAFGCVATIASASTISDIALGKSVQDIQKLTDVDVYNILGELPIDKQYCVLLGIEALNNALLDYYKFLEKSKA